MKKIISKFRIITAFAGVLFISQTIAFAQVKTVEVPMKFRDGMPAIDIIINGEGPFLFGIDTGTPRDGMVDDSVVKRLGLKKVGTAMVGDPSGKNMQTIDLVGIESVKIGNMEFRNLETVVQGDIAQGATKVDGILGIELFKNYLLTLDYSAKIVRIEEGTLPESNGKDILDFENPHGIPVIKLGIGNQIVSAHIDSGNSKGGFILPMQLAEQTEFASEPRVIGKARTVSSIFEIKEAKLKDKISFGSFEYTAPTITYPGPSPTEANIGSAVLRDYALTFDQKNKRVKLDKKGWKEEPVVRKGENAALKEYVGQYGDRTISEDGESLFLQRPNGMKLKLVKVTEDEYFPEPVPTAKIKFVRDESGKITEINVLTPDGTWQKAKKN